LFSSLQSIKQDETNIFEGMKSAKYIYHEDLPKTCGKTINRIEDNADLMRAMQYNPHETIASFL